MNRSYQGILEEYCQSTGNLKIQDRYQLIKPLRIIKAHPYEVYEVDDAGTRKILKVLTKDWSKYFELFDRETKIIQQIKHPGIPKFEERFTLELLTKHFVHCLVMEKIEGQNLEHWLLENKQLPQMQAIDWLKQILEILENLHQKQFAHRDIKPSNIMLRPDGRIVLIDFGGIKEITRTYLIRLARGEEATSIISNGYTPPEQIQGQAVLQSDFFALGRTFVHLLTGNHPNAFLDSSDSLVWRNQDPQILNNRFADLLDRLMASSPRKRPQTTQAIFDKLHEIDVETDTLLQDIETQMRSVLSDVFPPIKLFLEQMLRRELAILAKKKTKIPIIALYGRTQSGKSSLINALMDKRVAEIGGDGEPVTKEYQDVEYEQNGYKLKFVDTRGLGESHNQEAEKQSIAHIVEVGIDVVLFVVPAADPGYVDNDIEFLTNLRAAYQQKYNTKLPVPVILVLNKIDNISPHREWNPPYDLNLDSPTVKSAKEVNIRKCIKNRLNAYKMITDKYVPICALWNDEDGDQRYNMTELIDRIWDSLPEEARLGFLGVTNIQSIKKAVSSSCKLPATLATFIISLVPVPLIDIALVLTIQVTLVRMIAKVANNETSNKTAQTFLKDLGIQPLGFGGAVGFSTTVAKQIWPFIGAIPAAISLPAITWAIGDAAVSYFIEGVSIEKAKQTFEQEKERRKQIIGDAIKGGPEKVAKTLREEIDQAVHERYRVRKLYQD